MVLEEDLNLNKTVGKIKLVTTDTVLLITVAENKFKENLIETNNLYKIPLSIIMLDPPSISNYIQPNCN